MGKQPIPIREVARLSKKSRQAVYKAIAADRLTEADLYGMIAVADNHKLAEFLRRVKRNGKKK